MDLSAFGEGDDTGFGDLGGDDEDDELDEDAFGALMDDDEEDPEISNLLSDLE